MLLAQDVEKRFGEIQALRGVSLEVWPGEILALLGPNGSGKSTLVSIVADLLRPDAGLVRIDGLDPRRDGRAARKRLGLAPQDLAIIPVVTAYENLLYMGELAGLQGARLKRRIGEVSEMLLLTSLLRRPARALSTGEKRRLNTAMAILHEPTLVLLDEPTAGVDIDTRTNLTQLIHLIVSRGSAVVYCTHYLTEVEELDARVAIIDGGRIIADGSVREIIAAHGSQVVEARLSGEIPLYEAAPGEEVTFHEGVARITTPDPYCAVHRLFAAADVTRTKIEMVEVIKPSLEAAYLRIAGRRYDHGSGRQSG